MQRRYWLIFFVLVSAARLYLTGDRDILAVNSPHDGLWYVADAQRLIWGPGDYNNLSFAQLPVFSCWLLLLHWIGIPARLGIDLALIASAGYLAFALKKFTRQSWPGAVCFTFLLFHPYTIIIFDNSLAEELTCVLVIAAMASAMQIWTCARVPGRARTIAITLFGCFFALAFHTRKEGVVLFVPLIALFAYSLYARGQWWKKPLLRSPVAFFFLIPVLATVALGVALAGANAYRWGVFARHELAAPGYVAAMSALNRIDAGRTPRQIGIDSHTLALAFAQSPTFAELKPFYEGAQGKGWATYTFDALGIKNEIASGWFYWAFRDFAAAAGWHQSAQQADKKYAKAARELNRAFAEGRLKARPLALSAFIDPDYAKWLPYLPASFMKEFRLVWEPRAFPSEVQTATPIEYATFVKMVGRRNPGQLVWVRGWIIAPPDTTLSLMGKKDLLAQVVLSDPQRPDVPGGYPFFIYANTGMPSELLVRTPSGLEGEVALTDIKPGKVVRTTGAFDAPMGIDEINSVTDSSRLERLTDIVFKTSNEADGVIMLSRAYGLIGDAFWLIIALAFAAAVGTSRWRSASLLFALVLLSAIFARALLFGILDASSWDGGQGRYLMPAVPMFAVSAVLAMAALVEIVRSHFSWQVNAQA